MRAITIRRPWTLPILTGDKSVENRRQNTRYRGPLAIHVSRSRSWPPDPRVAELLPTADGHLFRLAMTPGAIGAVVNLLDCHRDNGCCGPWADHGPGIWHLILTDVHPLPNPLPATGRLGVWTPPPEITARITSHIVQPTA